MSFEKAEHSRSLSISFVMDSGVLDLNLHDLVNLYFIEDIFSFVNVGKIQFFDEYGIHEFGPLTGNEGIFIKYGEENTVEKYFKIYKIERVQQTKNTRPGDSSLIELTFVDPIYFLLNNQRYSYSWKDKKISDIVGYIGTNFLDVEFEEFEESSDILDFYYMGWNTPAESIKWLSKRAQGNKSGAPGFLFYTNGKGINWTTLESLLSQKNLMKIGDSDNGTYYLEDSNLFLYNKILTWEISMPDSFAFKGLMGGYRMGYNPKKKKFLDESYSYKDAVGKYTMLGQKTLFIDISNEDIDYAKEGESDTKFLDNIFYSDWINRYCLQNCVIITIRGHEERHAGGMIEIEWPSRIDDERLNKNYGGKYLIKAITHQFTAKQRPYYRQKMILIKNAYADPDHISLLKSSKYNLGQQRLGR